MNGPVNTSVQPPGHAARMPARVNGVPLHAPGDAPGPQELRQRACTELLRQAAQRAGLLGADDTPTDDGIPSEAACAAIEQLLASALAIPEPTPQACRRHYDANASRYRLGERAHVRHILFAVTPGVDLVALRQRAEHTLLDVRAHDGSADVFAAAARQLSNCPSAADGGALGWLSAADCAPEFAREIFGRNEVGVLPRLVHTRHGLHVVEVLQRAPGVPLPFEAVQDHIAATLRQHGYAIALRQYLAVLAAQARIEGVALDAAVSPLLQ
ncbi:MAG: peptidylprolyl isomerase [Hylemonella sp.]|jgi:peptidyl-prolyl cis-trans isomerase C